MILIPASGDDIHILSCVVWKNIVTFPELVFIFRNRANPYCTNLATGEAKPALPSDRSCYLFLSASIESQILSSKDYLCFQMADFGAFRL